MRFIDLFAGLGGFHKAFADMGHECVYASEVDETLRALYEENFPSMKGKILGDIRSLESKNAIPPHEILCAGFPCQPFSKSGFQKGLSDPTQGTLFHEIVALLTRHMPEYLILENVGNFQRHDHGRTWRIVKESLESLGYRVKGTEHVTTGGNGLLSPHHLGHPHTRERFYVVGRLAKDLPENPFPEVNRFRITQLADIVQQPQELSEADRGETYLTTLQRECIDHWNKVLQLIPETVHLPSFPVWSDELDAEYAFEHQTPYTMTTRALKRALRKHPQIKRDMTHEDLLRLLPSYARSKEAAFPEWKVQFIRQNRDWLRENGKYFEDSWLAELRNYPASLRKFEWNCNGEERNLWKHVLQFRPSGLRVKRYTSSPALVAMTSTQIPILGPEQRFITRVEGLRLQGFDDEHKLPASRVAAFRALGNAVHVEVVKEIARRLLPGEDSLDSAVTSGKRSLKSMKTDLSKRPVKSPSYKNFSPSSLRASQLLARSKATDTKCERLLRSALWRMGFRFRKNVRDLPGRPDIVFRGHRVAVFCDGDFWHGRNWAYRRRKLKKGANSSYWVAKIKANIDRDKSHDGQLRQEGWRVVRLWEKDILADAHGAASRVANLLSRKS